MQVSTVTKFSCIDIMALCFWWCDFSHWPQAELSPLKHLQSLCPPLTNHKKKINSCQQCVFLTEVSQGTVHKRLQMINSKTTVKSNKTVISHEHDSTIKVPLTFIYILWSATLPVNKHRALFFVPWVMENLRRHRYILQLSSTDLTEQSSQAAALPSVRNMKLSSHQAWRRKQTDTGNLVSIRQCCHQCFLLPPPPAS